MEDLRQAIGVARDFKPMPEKEMAGLKARVRTVAGDGRFELFKSTNTFEGVHHRRQHGFAT